MLIPKEPVGVLAKITTITDRGRSEWYEVVYHDGDKWCSYHGSDTFENGEKVEKWKYAKEIMEDVG